MELLGVSRHQILVFDLSGVTTTFGLPGIITTTGVVTVVLLLWDAMGLTKSTRTLG